VITKLGIAMPKPEIGIAKLGIAITKSKTTIAKSEMARLVTVIAHAATGRVVTEPRAVATGWNHSR